MLGQPWLAEEAACGLLLCLLSCGGRWPSSQTAGRSRRSRARAGSSERSVSIQELAIRCCAGSRYDSSRAMSYSVKDVGGRGSPSGRDELEFGPGLCPPRHVADALSSLWTSIRSAARSCSRPSPSCGMASSTGCWPYPRASPSPPSSGECPQRRNIMSIAA